MLKWVYPLEYAIQALGCWNNMLIFLLHGWTKVWNEDTKLSWYFFLIMFFYYCSTQDLEETDGKRKVLLTSYHVTPILEHCKVSSTFLLIMHLYISGHSVTFNSYLVACDNICCVLTGKYLLHYSCVCTMYQLLINFSCIVFKIGSTRKLIAVAYGQKGGKQNVAILEKLVSPMCPTASLTS